MTVRIVRLGTPRLEGEGVRLGTVRRPPRGVPKADWASRDFFDVWLPLLAPSEALLHEAHAARDAAGWQRFARKYRAEMKHPDPSRTLDLLAALSHGADFSVGCYCEDASRCHRGLLHEMLAERRANIG